MCVGRVVAVTVEVMLAETAVDEDAVALDENVAINNAVAVRAALAVPVAKVVELAATVTDDDIVNDGVTVAEAEVVAMREVLAVTVDEALGETDLVGNVVGCDEQVAEAVVPADADALTVLLGLNAIVGVGDREAEVVQLAVGAAERVLDTDAVGECVTETLGVT